MNTLYAFLDRAVAWLTPARRRALYAAATVLGTIVVAVGLTDPQTSTTYVAAGVATVEALSLLLASVKARSGIRTAAYALGAAVLVIGKLAGVVTDGQESHVLELLGHALALAPLLLAVVKTSPQTPTGEPLEEYRARHGSRPLDVADVDALIGSGAPFPNALGSAVPLTAEAAEKIRAFQVDTGLYVDGLLEPQTWAVLTRPGAA